MCLSENGYQIFTYEEQLLFCSRSFLWFGAHKQKMWWQSLPTEARWTNWWSSWRAPWTWWPRRLSRNRWLHVKAWLLSSPRTRNVWGPLPSEGIFSEVEDFRVKKLKMWWKMLLMKERQSKDGNRKQVDEWWLFERKCQQPIAGLYWPSWWLLFQCPARFLSALKFSTIFKKLKKHHEACLDVHFAVLSLC